MGSDRDAMLDRVYGRARQLWWRRRVAPVAAAMLVLIGLLTAPVMLHDSGGDPRKVAAIDQPTTTVDETTTALEAVPTTVVEAPTTTSTTTSLVCRNSYDPKCGPFRWDPAPAPNQPINATVTFSPPNPKVGDEVVFTLSAEDPDANLGCMGSSFGDHTNLDTACGYGPIGCAPEAYGPWTPPPPKGDSVVREARHAYAAAGTYEAQVMIVSGTFDTSGQPTPCGFEGPDGRDPYRSVAYRSVTVVVAS